MHSLHKSEKHAEQGSHSRAARYPVYTFIPHWRPCPPHRLPPGARCHSRGARSAMLSRHPCCRAARRSLAATIRRRRRNLQSCAAGHGCARPRCRLPVLSRASPSGCPETQTRRSRRERPRSCALLASPKGTGARLAATSFSLSKISSLRSQKLSEFVQLFVDLFVLFTKFNQPAISIQNCSVISIAE